MGPNWSLWWGGSGPTPLSVPVVDEQSGAVTSLSVDSWKKACGDLWDLNSGQASDWGCSHSVLLRLSATGNEHLEPGHSYRSPGSSPLVIRGIRWHQPGAGTVLGTFAFELSYTAL